MANTAILFVCMGNICRSPTAQGVFTQRVAARAPELDLAIDSAGTHAYHVGHAPDPRAQAAALERGVDISDLRARVVDDGDFIQFDYVLAMDESNYTNLKERCLPGYESRIKLFLDYAPQCNERFVPDPYYGGGDGFIHVLDLVEQASDGLIDALKQA